MRRVLNPLLATAAERLMAVVVFPTPPFWFATVMIIWAGNDSSRRESGAAGFSPPSATVRRQRPFAVSDRSPSATVRRQRLGGLKPAAPLHLVLAHIFRRKVLEPFLHLLVLILGIGTDGLGLVKNGLGDEDRRFGAQRESNRVTRARVDFERFAS